MNKLAILLGTFLVAAVGVAAYSPGPLYSDNNLSDLQSAASALSNLGLTSSAAELNYTDGVTSAIQTQLDAKAPSASPTFTTKTTHSYATASTVATFNASKELVSSAVTGTELGLLSGADRVILVERQPLAAVRTAGGVLGWANPTGGSILVTKIVLDVTTASTGASTIDCGIGTNATTSSDVLIDGVSGGSIAVLDNIEDQGTNGKSSGKASSTQAVTCSEASGDVTGLAGYVYIYYHAI